MIQFQSCFGHTKIAKNLKAKKQIKKVFQEWLGAQMVKTHISTFLYPYLKRKRYGSQEVEIWVSAE
jgi:predicted transcriptional regulator YdeE